MPSQSSSQNSHMVTFKPIHRKTPPRALAAQRMAVGVWAFSQPQGLELVAEGCLPSGLLVDRGSLLFADAYAAGHVHVHVRTRRSQMSTATMSTVDALSVAFFLRAPSGYSQKDSKRPRLYRRYMWDRQV